MPPQILIKKTCLVILFFPDSIKKSIARIKIKETSVGINGEESSKAAKIRTKKTRQIHKLLMIAAITNLMVKKYILKKRALIF